MAKSASRTGAGHLAQKNAALMSRTGQPRLADILIVEDETIDADRMRAMLHIMFGYGLQIRRALTLGSALDCVIERKPDIVFLDDYLKPADNASHTIPFLRRAGYDGPIIVVSGRADRQRRAELKAAGAADVIHKDDIDTVQLTAALNRILGPQAPDGGSA
jgi:DNA-binding NarL/FixJ family response regulator